MKLTRREAFGLVEILVAVAVIAVLVALTIPTLRQFQKNAESTKCANNLRQIGVGINSYSQDNDGMLPGPLFFGQSSAAKETSRGQLVIILAGYLNLRGESSATHKYNLFICPSYSAELHGKEGVCYGITDYGPVRPWGYPNPDTDGKPRNPMKMAILPGVEDSEGNPINPATTIAMRDISKENYKGASKLPGWYDELADNNVHGTHVNALYYDWHVERLPLSEQAAN